MGLLSCWFKFCRLCGAERLLNHCSHDTLLKAWRKTVLNRKLEEVRENRRAELLKGNRKNNFGPGRLQEFDRGKWFKEEYVSTCRVDGVRQDRWLSIRGTLVGGSRSHGDQILNTQHQEWYLGTALRDTYLENLAVWFAGKLSYLKDKTTKQTNKPTPQTKANQQNKKPAKAKPLPPQKKPQTNNKTPVINNNKSLKKKNQKKQLKPALRLCTIQGMSSELDRKIF